MNLTDEDKNWILTQLARNNAELREHLADWIRSELAIHTAEIRKHVADTVEATETKLLTAFHQGAGPLDARVKSHSLALRAFDRENENYIDQAAKIAELERRVSRLERAS